MLISLSASEVTSVSGAPMRFSIAGRYYAESPSSGPEWGARFVVRLLFPK